MRKVIKAISVDFSSFSDSVPEALDRIGAGDVLSRQSAILIKPNLVNASPHPVTTAPECCKAVIEYVQSCSKADIVIAEGCGDSSKETDEIFDLLGYRELSDQCKVPLIDLNHAPLRKVKNRRCSVFPEMHLPEMAFTHFIISVPVLKAHSLAEMTGTLKNMVGFAPPEYYSGKYGVWKKALFHGDMQQAIIDLNRHRCPDLTLMDGSIGLPEYHLGGAKCDPPVAKLLAGFDPLAVDRMGAGFLGFDWKKISHLCPETPYEPVFGY